VARGKYKIIRCFGCGVKRRMNLLSAGAVNPEVLKLFETEGWLYKARSSGLCGNCNLLKGNVE
jgi:hypothetical protein